MPSVEPASVASSMVVPQMEVQQTLVLGQGNCMAFAGCEIINSNKINSITNQYIICRHFQRCMLISFQ